MVDKWLVVFAVDDLKSIPCNFKILGVDFHTFAKSDCNNWSFCKNKRLSQHALPRFMNKNCASTEVEADTYDDAFEKGNNKIEISLCALRAYKSGFELRRPLNGLAKNLRTGKEEIRLEAFWHRDRSSPWNYTLDQNELKGLSKNVIPIEQLIESPTPTVMGKRISRALRWTAMSTQETDIGDKIIKYTTALECLFIKERGGKAKRVAKRVAIFWTSYYGGNRDKIFLDIHRLYKLRNNIVHGEDFIVSKKDERTMDHVARNLVFAVAHAVSNNSLSTINDLLSWLNSKKGTWNPPPV